jgi:dihydroxyacetone kinase-like protein
MAYAASLVDLFESVARNLEQDRDHLNAMDYGDGDAGDNMAANWRLVAASVRKSVKKGGKKTDVGKALQSAARALKKSGKGATAPIYAQGLAEAGKRLQGQETFSIDTLLPLLQGLLEGAQRSSDAAPGQGSLLDALIPGVLSFIESKQRGASDGQAILDGLRSSRLGANRSATSASGAGRFGDSDKRGRVDPGAAGAASLLEGVFVNVLDSLLGGKASS